MNTLTKFSIVSLISLVSCSTVPDQPQTISPKRVQSIATLAAYTSAKIILLREPDLRPRIELAYNGLSELVASENWDLPSMIAIASANGLDVLKSEEGILIFTGAAVMLDLFTDQTVDLNSNEYARAVILGTRRGLGMALISPEQNKGQARTGDAVYNSLLKHAKSTRP